MDKFKSDLAQIHAAPAPLPLPDPKDARDARKAADRVSKDADKAAKLADQAKDPDERAKKQEVAEKVQKIADKADASATRTEANVKAAEADPNESPSDSSKALPLGSPIEPPTTPTLADLDMDTGKPSNAGEYVLADQTYAHLLNDLVKPAAPPSPTGTAGSAKAAVMPAATIAHSDFVHMDNAPSLGIDPAVAADIEHFFARRVAPTGIPPSPKEARKEAKIQAQVAVDLATLKILEAIPFVSPATTRR